MANVLPFSHIDNNELFLEMENKTELIDTTPSFSIQSLLDEMPGQNFSQIYYKREFGDELSKANWTEIIDTNVGTDLSYNNFYRKIENILDYMAPYTKLTREELKREQMPWKTRGILVSMGIRDTLYKTWTEEKDSQFKDIIVALYKRYRNLIVNLLRRSKSN